MKKIAKRLCAAVLTVCMALSMALSASALTTYTLELEIVDRVKGRSVTESRSNIGPTASLVDVLVGLVSENVTSDQKNEWIHKASDWEDHLEDYDLGLYVFGSEWLMDNIIKKGLEASEDQDQWRNWVSAFGGGEGVDKDSAVDLRNYLSEFTTQVQDLDSGKYILTYDPMLDTAFRADVHDNSKDWAYDNFYTFTLTVSRRVTGSSSIARFEIKLNCAIGASATVSAKEASAGEKITVTVNPNEGYEVNAVTVVAPNSGRIEVIDNGDGTYTFTMPTCAVTVNVTVKAKGDASHENCPASKFDDVDLDAWYHAAIDYVCNNGLMSGQDDKSFKPDAPLSRAMVAQIFYNLEGQPVVEHESKFPDVTKGKWYYDAVTWAHRHTTVAGYGDGLYRPEQDVTREELVQIFFNYAVAKGWTQRGYIADLMEYADGSEVASWHSEAMSWGLGVELLSGKGGKVLDPKEASVRAEAAQMLMNLYEKVRK